MHFVKASWKIAANIETYSFQAYAQTVHYLIVSFLNGHWPVTPHIRHESPIPTQPDFLTKLSWTETKAVKTPSTLREDWALRFSGRLKPEAIPAGGLGLKTQTPVGGGQGCIRQVILSYFTASSKIITLTSELLHVPLSSNQVHTGFPRDLLINED